MNKQGLWEHISTLDESKCVSLHEISTFLFRFSSSDSLREATTKAVTQITAGISYLPETRVKYQRSDLDANMVFLVILAPTENKLDGYRQSNSDAVFNEVGKIGLVVNEHGMIANMVSVESPAFEQELFSDFIPAAGGHPGKTIKTLSVTLSMLAYVDIMKMLPPGYLIRETPFRIAQANQPFVWEGRLQLTTVPPTVSFSDNPAKNKYLFDKEGRHVRIQEGGGEEYFVVFFHDGASSSFRMSKPYSWKDILPASHDIGRFLLHGAAALGDDLSKCD